MRNELTWNLDQQGGATRVTLTGALTERSNLGKLAGELAACKEIRFDLGGVARINSSGVREWLELMRALPATIAMQFENCSTSIVHQINLIRGFTGHAKVCSIRVPLVCAQCGREEAMTIAVERGTVPAVPTSRCAKCTREMELDDLAETYFAFLLR